MQAWGVTAMRRFLLSDNKFEHFQAQCGAGELHAAIPSADCAELLRGLLDVPIALAGLIMDPGASRPGDCTHFNPAPTGSMNGLTGMLRRLMREDGITVIPDLRDAGPGSEPFLWARTNGVQSLAGLLCPAEGDEAPCYVCVMDHRRRGYTVGELELLQRVVGIVRARESLKLALTRAATTPAEDETRKCGRVLQVLQALANPNRAFPCRGWQRHLPSSSAHVPLRYTSEPERGGFCD